MTNVVGEARLIIDLDVAAAANVFKTELATPRAVMSVESRNSGFDHTRRPAILFEPHVLYRSLSGPERKEAVRLGLAYERWGHTP